MRILCSSLSSISRVRFGLPVLIGWAGLFLAGSVALAQDLACQDCHDGVVVTSPQHEEFECNLCHSNIDQGPHQDKPLEELAGAALCGQCHDAEAGLLKESVHADLAECYECHGKAHAVLRPSDLSSATAPLKQIQTCGQCHDDEGLIDGYLQSVHGRGLVVSGLINAPSCSDCHGTHAIFAHDDPRSSVSLHQVPETCGQCHQYLLIDWRDRSAHGRVWKEEKTGPVCTTCHSSHQVMEPTAADQRLKFPESCGGCHGFRYETYRDSFHGEVTELGFLTAATCSDCHTPHRALPASDPESTVNPDNLGETCGACHQRVNASFLTFAPHQDPSDPASGPVYWVWLGMTTLLISVFGFFAVHDLLWAQRSLVGFRRGEFAGMKRAEGPYLRRFEPSQVYIHATIISSFLLLAATGLPLKFHFAEWAQVLSGLFGGVSNTRFLHRLAALVTFGYAFFHLGQLFVRIVRKRNYGLLWGWNSLVPQPGDFRQLLANLRYFLYLGPRPQVDRWTYWEKFDYLAVFWGVVIIGLSGLMLWLPGFFTLLLPGWVLNAAFVIHSDEALLATVFIFVFHFFHTHLRPEIFPMDKSIFTGLVSLERFKEERPLEYQRLRNSGELDSMLVEAPPARLIRRAMIFGFSALSVGLVLALGILMAFLAH